MSNPFGPIDPDEFAKMADGGKVFYAMYKSYTDAGFTDDQAMQMITVMIATSLNGRCSTCRSQ